MVSSNSRMFRTKKGKLITTSDARRAGVGTNVQDLSTEDLDKLLAVASERIGQIIYREDISVDGSSQKSNIDELSKRRRTNQEFANSTFQRRLDRGDIAGAIDESIQEADNASKLARRIRFDLSRRQQEIEDMAAEAKRKFTIL